ncbi:Ubiquitin 1-activating enzyme E1 A [Fasciolopsis buskii]|uniref:Ubiquitin 1-activating enzyme E1 A n=1 Tax=Fasciolopsis buskii TaxID=27845 RepID=A0A8E0RZ83_9TREM|nr:Ubiquitin 1-activating enzyme E1 A [Fasciolopsis buski]
MCTKISSETNSPGYMENPVCISEAEAALYDRQIRLWGLEAQNKLKCARVLINGMTPVGAELVKNLVLAGIASMDILDEQIVTQADSSNFLIPVSAIGENRAKASVMRTQSLNAMVRVTAQDVEIFSDLENQLHAHDVIIITSECIKDGLSKWLVVDSALEKWAAGTKKPQVFYVCTQSTFGVAFFNLSNHEFLAEHIVPKKRTITPNSGPKTQQSSNTETVHTKKTVVYPTLREGLKLDWIQSLPSRRIPKGFWIMHLLQQHDLKNENIDLDSLRKMWAEISKKLKIPENTLADEDFECCCGPRIPAVNAVLGGVVAQEVVRAITAKGSPRGNWYFVDGVQCSVTVEWLPELKESL